MFPQPTPKVFDSDQLEHTFPLGFRLFHLSQYLYLTPPVMDTEKTPLLRQPADQDSMADPIEPLASQPRGDCNCTCNCEGCKTFHRPEETNNKSESHESAVEQLAFLTLAPVSLGSVRFLTGPSYFNWADTALGSIGLICLGFCVIAASMVIYFDTMTAMGYDVFSPDEREVKDLERGRLDWEVGLKPATLWIRAACILLAYCVTTCCLIAVFFGTGFICTELLKF